MKNTAYPSILRAGPGEIRLIRIHPGRWSNQIRCDLLHDTLSSPHPYPALSYVWGSPKSTCPIILSSQVST
ncbi:hypothetical protein BU23DRAFT_77156 [Bimuria novae-zelandiae CBS 107.79]|uniref:Heterokaryon incompatibility domain-containing protein n=1 Tax=Bimuria novae-zelandiae CBS 107.79 TaxID=1447943 RepID=A0A6A5VFX4_9PLEO|nr:hypothetical protein BU23DRAFT_77156 [Bimuria novae-zelandiae CBS 107.79]